MNEKDVWSLTMNLKRCDISEIWCSHSAEYDDNCFGLLNPKEGRTTIILNVDNYLQFDKS
jgi:hypothetical protein